MIHQYGIDGKGGVFADDTPVLDRGEVRMHGDGAPELQLRFRTDDGAYNSADDRDGCTYITSILSRETFMEGSRRWRRSLDDERR